MTEKENIEYAKQQIAALNARDLNGYLSRIDDSYVGQSETAPGPIRGREGVRQHLETLFKAFPDLRIEIEQIITSGDSLVVLHTLRTGTHKGNFAGVAPTNKNIVLQGCNVLEITERQGDSGQTLRGQCHPVPASWCLVAAQDDGRKLTRFAIWRGVNNVFHA